MDPITRVPAPRAVASPLRIILDPRVGKSHRVQESPMFEAIDRWIGVAHAGSVPIDLVITPPRQLFQAPRS